MSSKDLMMVSLRLNQKIPEHARIISVLKDLNKKYHTTLNSFVIEALSFYIENVSNEKITNLGKAKASKNSGKIVTEDFLEERLDLYDQALKRWLLDCFVSFSVVANRFPSPVSSAHSFPGEGNTTPKEYDLTDYPDIMKDITAWSED
jgi:hypothetical protein